MKAKIRLFIPETLKNNTFIELSKVHQHYLLDVMRCKNDHLIKIFNGVDGEWIARISSASKKNCTIEILYKLSEQQNNVKLTLAFAPTKNTSTSYIIQKATELGVSDIVPIITKRTIVNKTNLDKLKIVAIEAAEQCERMSIPQIYDVTKLVNFIDSKPFAGNLILCDETRQSQPALVALRDSKDQDNVLLIGPEGGFDESELDWIKSKSFTISMSLGPRILRADTAAIAAVAIYQTILGDWK